MNAPPNIRFVEELKTAIKDSGTSINAWTGSVGSGKVSARTIRAALVGEAKLTHLVFMYTREKAIESGFVIHYDAVDFYNDELAYHGL